MSVLTLRVKTKSGQNHLIKSLTEDHTVKDLKQQISTVSNVPLLNIEVLFGFPPKALDCDDDSTLGKSGIINGDTLILREKSIGLQKNEEALTHSAAVSNSMPVTNSVSETNDADPDSMPPGILMKQVVPADNSCLFSSIHFVLNGKMDETGQAASYLRRLVAETISNNKHKYDEAMLDGKSVDGYCAWIQDDSTWGGAIELAIFSEYYGIEIDVVNTVSAAINRFGEDQHYSVRVFLMFDGIHYDPIYLEPINGDRIQTMFQTSDEAILNEAKSLANEAKSCKQYTDVNNFTLKCLQCNEILHGEAGAQSHAKSKGHTNFGEV